MFNNIVKEVFIEKLEELEGGISKTYVEFIFNHSESIEKRFNKDIFEFNDYEVEELLNSFNQIKGAGRFEICRLLKLYVNFAIENGYSRFTNIFETYNEDDEE